MLLGNDDRIWVRPRPEWHATEFSWQREIHGKKRGLQVWILWRDFDEGYWERGLERFFARVERGIAELPDDELPDNPDNMLCEYCGLMVPSDEMWEHDCD